MHEDTCGVRVWFHRQTGRTASLNWQLTLGVQSQLGVPSLAWLAVQPLWSHLVVSSAVETNILAPIAAQAWHVWGAALVAPRGVIGICNQHLCTNCRSGLSCLGGRLEPAVNSVAVCRNWSQCCRNWSQCYLTEWEVSRGEPCAALCI